MAVVLVQCVAAGACNSVLDIPERTEGNVCDVYCSTMDQNCRGDFQQYQDRNVCLSVCADLRVGDFNGKTEDTLACRFERAKLAEEDPARFCKVAGLAAFDGEEQACGDACSVFCKFMVSKCGGVVTLADDQEECETLCTSLPRNAQWTPEDPALKDHDNSFECRVWHLGVAFSAQLHCEHADGTLKCDGKL